MAKDAGGASGGLKKATTTKPIIPKAVPSVVPKPAAKPPDMRPIAPAKPPSVDQPISQGIVNRVTPPKLIWDVVRGLTGSIAGFGSWLGPNAMALGMGPLSNFPPQNTLAPYQYATGYGTVGAGIDILGIKRDMEKQMIAGSTQSARNAAHSEALQGGTYPEDFSWREYLADPTKPEEAAPSLVEQSRIMGEISRAINRLDAGGADVEDYGYLFDNSGYGWGDGWGGGGGYSQYGYGPDSMLYQWRIGL